MPEITSCPDCDKKLKVPDTLIGKRVKCPGCKGLFTARAPGSAGLATGRTAPPPPPRRRDEEDEDDRPRGRRDDYDDRRDRRDEDEARVRGRRRDADEDDEDDRRPRRSEQDRYDVERPRDVASLWRGVKGGINLWVNGQWLLMAVLGAYLAAALLVMLVALISRDLWVTMVLGGILYGLVLLAALAAFVMQMIGMGQCMQAPNDEDHPTRTLAVAAFCCNIAPIVLSLLAFPVMFLIPVLGALSTFVLAPLNVALIVAGWILWVMFLRSCAYQARSRDLAERLMRWLVTWLVFTGSMIVLYVIVLIVMIGAGAAGGGRAAVGVLGIFFGLLMLGAGIFWLVLHVWLLNLAAEVRDVVGRGRKRR
ncbi:MAG: hypothetical protein ACRC33_11630 [Gemmataceae bacterium]